MSKETNPLRETGLKILTLKDQEDPFIKVAHNIVATIIDMRHPNTSINHDWDDLLVKWTAYLKDTLQSQSLPEPAKSLQGHTSTPEYHLRNELSKERGYRFTDIEWDEYFDNPINAATIRAMELYASQQSLQPEDREEVKDEIPDPEAIHSFFGLTYANYLVIPRVALQSMPSEWQRQFVKLVEAISDTLPEYSDMHPENGYHVSCKDYNGKFVADKFPHYQRGRARLKSVHNK